MVLQTTYDDTGRRLTFTDPSTGTWRYGYGGFDQVISRGMSAGGVSARRCRFMGSIASNLYDEAIDAFLDEVQDK